MLTRILIATLATVFLIAPAATGQDRPRSANAKALGQVNSFWVGSTRQRHAYDHARVLNRVATGTPTVQKEIVQGHAAAIRSHSQAAMKEFAALKDSKNQEVTEHLEKLHKHHQQVLAMCDMLDECCKKPEAESPIVCDCCKNVTKELATAEKEAEQLREVLKIAPLDDGAATKAEGAKQP